MRELRSEVVISASPERVWQLLTDFDGFPRWNPFIRRASGVLQAGRRLDVYLKPSSGMGMAFRPTVVKVEPERELRWLGHVLVPGLFDGEHIFTIEPVDANSVRFTQREQFSGWLAPLLLLWIGKSTQSGFEEMNRALQARAEKDATTEKTASA